MKAQGEKIRMVELLTLSCFLWLMIATSLLVPASGGADVDAVQPFRILEHGNVISTYLSPYNADQMPNITDNGHALQLRFGERLYVMTNADHPHSSPNRSDFHTFSLINSTFNVSVDLRSAGCGCDLSVYLVAMPASSPGANHDWYCDGNNVGGNSCPEIDLTEMNIHGLHTTMHPCKKPYSSATCSHGGIGVARFGQGQSNYGQGSKFTIDTNNPVVVSVSFQQESEALSCRVSLSQGHAVVERTISNVSDILQPLMDGMVLVFSYWASANMGWLDTPPCTNNTPHCPAFATIANVSIS